MKLKFKDSKLCLDASKASIASRMLAFHHFALTPEFDFIFRSEYAERLLLSLYPTLLFWSHSVPIAHFLHSAIENGVSVKPSVKRSGTLGYG